MQNLDVDTAPLSTTLTGRVLADLQASRQFTDDEMAALLRTDADTLRAARNDKSKLKFLQITKVFDSWLYDQIRDALLKVAPEDLAAELRVKDIERGRRMLGR